MKRTTFGAGAAGLVASLLAGAGLALLAASCGPREPVSAAPVAHVPPPATATATASAAAPPAPTIDLKDPTAVSAVAWTDDDAIQALAQDCRWDPAGCIATMEKAAQQAVDMVEFLPEGAAQPEGDSRVLPAEACRGLLPLACAHVPSQACAPDECSQIDYTCVPRCDGMCADCAGKCVTGCELCKGGCKDEDDACRLECAKKCGECRQICVLALDLCTSAGCSEAAETCYRERDDAWTNSTCPKVCPKVQDCVEKCPEEENDWTGARYRSACAMSCLSKLGKGCPPRFNAICAGDPNASVNFNAYRANREALEAVGN